MLSELEVPPVTALVVSPEVPKYHLYVYGPVPPATTLRVVCVPMETVLFSGWVVIVGGSQTGPAP